MSLLVLTAADYALWDWSIAEGHDIVSLVAGLTLLPLAAVSLGGLVFTGARALGLLLGMLLGPRARAGARIAWGACRQSIDPTPRRPSQSRPPAGLPPEGGNARLGD